MPNSADHSAPFRRAEFDLFRSPAVDSHPESKQSTIQRPGHIDVVDGQRLRVRPTHGAKRIDSQHLRNCQNLDTRRGLRVSDCLPVLLCELRAEIQVLVASPRAAEACVCEVLISAG